MRKTNFFILVIAGGLYVFTASVVSGQPFQAPVQVTPPTQGLPTDLGQLIQQIFTWSLSLLGIAVFVMFFYAGFLWLTAAGNTARVGEAKSRMTNAVFGAILLLSSYLILYTINPNFVKNTFNLPGLGTPTGSEVSDKEACTDAEKSPTDNPPESLRSQIQVEMDKYTLPTIPEQQGQILNKVAWENKDKGWVLLGKAGGNNCPSPAGTLISCDHLVHQPTMLGYDVFSNEGASNMKASWNGPDACINKMVQKRSRTLVNPVQP